MTNSYVFNPKKGIWLVVHLFYSPFGITCLSLGVERSRTFKQAFTKTFSMNIKG